MTRAFSLTLLTALMLALPAPANAQQASKHRDAYLNIALSGKGCDVMLPAFNQVAQQAVAAGEPWWAVAAALDSAICQVKSGQTAEAVKTLAIAERLGLDDCWTFRNTNLWSLRTDPTMQGILARIRQAPADFQEITWHQTEIRQIMHDTSMMITENMNRKDTDWTVVPRSTLPSHATASRAVRAMRLLTQGVQQYQANMVLRSDQSRLNHLTTMGIIRNWPGSRSGVNVSAIRSSQLLSQQRAQARAATIQGRAFRYGGSTSPRACSQY